MFTFYVNIQYLYCVILLTVALYLPEPVYPKYLARTETPSMFYSSFFLSFKEEEDIEMVLTVTWKVSICSSMPPHTYTNMYT